MIFLENPADDDHRVSPHDLDDEIATKFRQIMCTIPLAIRPENVIPVHTPFESKTLTKKADRVGVDRVRPLKLLQR